MVVWAVGVGVVGNGLGFTLALWLDQPPGPVLVCSVAVLSLLSFLPARRTRMRPAPASMH
jgi:zinc transport system permease protein